MSTQHTPGPWTNHGRIPQPGLPHSVVAAKTLIARVYSEAFGDEAQETANARLIAAAPDMYEALKHEAEWHEAQARTHKTLAQRNPGMVYDGLKEAWHKERAATLRAVLVKAEGKS